jgi:hypothetical protein
MLIFTVLMEIFFPKINTNEYQSFIVAFEFASTPRQIHQLFEGFSADAFRNINIGNYIDFGFMITYTLFLALFFKYAAKIFNMKWLLSGIPLSIIVLLADVVENIYLLQITAMYTPDISDAELIPVLKNLHTVTWIKWGGLALIFALYSVKAIGKRFLSHIEGVVFVFPFILIFWAVSNDPMGVSRFTLSIALSFFLLLFYCFWHKTKKIEKFKKKIAVS